MNKLYLIFLLIIATLISSCGTTHVSKVKEQPFKILSYNVRNARGMDDVTDFKRIADVINRINADFVAVQELDSATVRSGGAAVLEEIAKHTDYYASYNKSIDYQGGGYGIGVLTKAKPIRKTAIPLPGSEEKRSLLVVETADYIICCTHWSLTKVDRLLSVDVINNFVKNFKNKPIFLAGDLNATPESEEMKKLTANWQILNDITKPTIPSIKPNKCIDYVLMLNNDKYFANVTETKVEDEPVASDHLPVWVVVSIDKH